MKHFLKIHFIFPTTIKPSSQVNDAHASKCIWVIHMLHFSGIHFTFLGFLLKSFFNVWNDPNVKTVKILGSFEKVIIQILKSNRTENP